MNNKEMNQAIYAKLCEIADKYLNAASGTEELRKATENKPTLTFNDLNKSETRYGNPLFLRIMFEMYADTDDYPIEKIEVGNFKGSFDVRNLLDIMQKFGKGYSFTMPDNDEREIIASFSMQFDAKRLAEFTQKKDDYGHPVLNHVLVEYDKVTQAVTFAATNSRVLAVMTEDDASLLQSGNDTATAIVTAEDWKRICDAMRKKKQDAKFTLRNRNEGETFDTLALQVGDLIVKSVQLDQKFPNWRIVIPAQNDLRYYEIHADDRKIAQKWFSKLKKRNELDYVSVSVYEGSDRIYFDYCDITELDWNREKHEYNKRVNRMSVSFRMTKVADRTEGVGYDPDTVKKILPIGFRIIDKDHGTLIEDSGFDRLLVMPKMSDVVTFDVEKREVLAFAECA